MAEICMEGTGVSCGVRQFYDFYNDVDDGNDGYYDEDDNWVEGEFDPEVEYKEPEQSLREFMEAYMVEQDDRCYGADDGVARRRSVAGTFIFSDVVDGPGDRFGLKLREWYPNTELYRSVSLNPNSNHQIATYMWTISVEQLRQHELWEKVRDAHNKRKKENELKWGKKY